MCQVYLYRRHLSGDMAPFLLPPEGAAPAAVALGGLDLSSDEGLLGLYVKNIYIQVFIHIYTYMLLYISICVCMYTAHAPARANL